MEKQLIEVQKGFNLNEEERLQITLLLSCLILAILTE